MQIIPKLYIVQEVGNVGNRKGVNGKYYFSNNEVNTGNTVFFVCLKYDVFSPFLCQKNYQFSNSVILRFLWLSCIDKDNSQNNILTRTAYVQLGNV